jgi:hypothetical protein
MIVLAPYHQDHPSHDEINATVLNYFYSPETFH